MIIDLFKDKVAPQAYQTYVQLFGEPPEVKILRQDLATAKRKWQTELSALTTKHEKELESVRQERLEWMAKASTVRKELMDSQDRNKDLLEQVVRLTHQKRTSAQDLLEQKFKTESTPSERTRHEIELTEARGKVRQAEEKARTAEAKMAHYQTERNSLVQKAKRVKSLESNLAWSKKKSHAIHQALGATIAHIKKLEVQLSELSLQVGHKTKRSYQKPGIYRARRKLAAAFLALR
jgi:chromosome segregation ATPase